jgi:DNA mismatch repair protein MutS2
MIDEGTNVRIKGQSTIGIIEQLRGRQATVLFGHMRTTLPLDMLELASDVVVAQPRTTVNSYISKQTLDQMHKTQLNFHSEIDVRGMRGDEALGVVTRFIDDATLVGASRLRILHGTGTGALRQLIRQYLQTIPNVRSARDEHVQFGGAGITVVELE